MSLSNFNKKVENFFTNKKGAGAILTILVGAILSTMGAYFFKTVDTLSIEKKQKIVSLSNASTTAEVVKAVIDGMTDGFTERLDGDTTVAELEGLVSAAFHSGAITSLAELEDQKVLDTGLDPVATQRSGTDTEYDVAASKIKITWVSTTAVEIVAATTAHDVLLVDNLILEVNLAGPTDAVNNAPYAASTPFFYIVMFDDSACDPVAGTNCFKTIDSGAGNEFPLGILDTNSDGLPPSYITSVILPEEQDYAAAALSGT
jgi:hypothetical protein